MARQSGPCKYCDRPAKTRSMCAKCYMRWTINGKPPLETWDGARRPSGRKRTRPIKPEKPRPHAPLYHNAHDPERWRKFQQLLSEWRTIQELAELLEVNMRTIQRDLVKFRQMMPLERMERTPKSKEASYRIRVGTVGVDVQDDVTATARAQVYRTLLEEVLATGDVGHALARRIRRVLSET